MALAVRSLQICAMMCKSFGFSDLGTFRYLIETCDFMLLICNFKFYNAGSRLKLLCKMVYFLQIIHLDGNRRNWKLGIKFLWKWDFLFLVF